MQTLKCPHCGSVNDYELSEVIFDLAESYINCYNCIKTITFITEIITINDGKTYPTPPVLRNGTIVVIINEEHIWSGEIALICGIKHKHYRIELLGKKIWVPFEWVKQTDDNP